MEQESIDKLVKANPGVKLRLIELAHEDKTYEFVVTVPSREIFAQIKHHAQLGQDEEADKVAVYKCLKFPDKAVAAEIISEFPAFLGLLSLEIVALAGAGATAKRSKLA